MCAALNDAAMIHDQYLICVHDSGKPVCNYERRVSSRNAIELSLNRFFRFRIERRRRFIADAAHQLRTPIAGLKTQTELALRQTPPGEAHATLRQLRSAAEQTTRLVNQLLSLARAEPTVGRAQASDVIDLRQLAREVTTEWVPRAIERNVDLGFDADSQVAEVEGDAFLLREMLNNVLDNAVRYTQSGGQVTVRIARSSGGPMVSIEDNGPGIPDSERAHVFERFYRVLGTGAEGCGLGLAIVREIAQSHGAEVSLTPGAGGTGTIATIIFPPIAHERAA
jgi:two-component system sensor histidine kinase TctE